VRWYEAEEIMPQPPKRVTKDTGSWREQFDLIFAFFHEVPVPDVQAHIVSTELHWGKARQ
jgi:hypothetical protein